MVFIAPSTVRPKSREELLRRAEQDMAYATTWINDSRCIIHQQKHLLRGFLQVRAQASEEYAAALRMPEEAVKAPQPAAQGEMMFTRSPLRESPQPPPDEDDLPFGGLLGVS